MITVFDPFSFLVVSIAGWMNQHQLQHVVWSKNPNRRPKGENRIVDVIAFRDARRCGSIFISGRFDCRLDEPAATPSHRILLEENRVLREQISPNTIKAYRDVFTL